MVMAGACIGLNLTGRFREALAWAEAVRSELGRTTRYVSPILDYQAGLACMALGRARDAADWYARGLEDARRRNLGDTSTVLFGEILTAELALERRAAPTGLGLAPTSVSVLAECGAWFDIYAAGIGVAAELALHEQGADAALGVVDDARDYARATGRHRADEAVECIACLAAGRRPANGGGGTGVAGRRHACDRRRVPWTLPRCTGAKRRR